MLGTIEAIRLPDASADVVISNCAINLSTDKPAVFAEIFRVLVPGGRLGVSDVVAVNHLDLDQRGQRGSYVGCVAGALSMREYRDGLAAAGFTNITITTTHQVAQDMHSAIIRVTQPASPLVIQGEFAAAGWRCPEKVPVCGRDDRQHGERWGDR